MTTNMLLRLPEDLATELETQAKRDERSRHAEVVWLLRQALEANRLPATLERSPQPRPVRR